MLRRPIRPLSYSILTEILPTCLPGPSLLKPPCVQPLFANHNTVAVPRRFYCHGCTSHPAVYITPLSHSMESSIVDIGVGSVSSEILERIEGNFSRFFV